MNYISELTAIDRVGIFYASGILFHPFPVSSFPSLTLLDLLASLSGAFGG